MKKIIIGIVLLAAIAAGVYYFVKNSEPEEVVEQKPEESSTKYTSYQYWYAFTLYGEGWKVNDEDPANVIISGADGGHWGYQVSATKEQVDGSLLPLVEAEAQAWMEGLEAFPDRQVTITDTRVAGERAKYVSISNTGDYGNTFVMLKGPKGLLTIIGDDSTPANKAAFEKFLASFSFDGIKLPTNSGIKAVPAPAN